MTIKELQGKYDKLRRHHNSIVRAVEGLQEVVARMEGQNGFLMAQLQSAQKYVDIQKQVVVDNAFPIQESKSRLTSAVYLRISNDQMRINSQLTSEIEKIFSRYRGKAEVYFEVCMPEGTVTLAANSIHKINPTLEFERDIQSVLGENSIKYRIIF